MDNEQKAWRCTLCGYVHRGATPPEFCPICGASAGEFELYEEPTATVSKTAPKQWRCLNCNYIHDGDSPPEMCPICAANSDRFEALKELEQEQGSESESIKAVIVGGGIAGVSAAESIRDTSPGSSITLISSEASLPYYRLNLTRYLAGEIDYTALPMHPESWYSEKDIKLIQGKGIANISRDENFVQLDNGDTIPYDKLILAMGSHPFVPPIPGSELANVFTLRTSEDADAILQKLKTGVPCVCIGGGILGLETAGALAKRGGDITLLESHEWLMPRQLNKEAADVLESHMTNIGVKLRKTARTKAFQEIDGMAAEVLLEDGENIPCGMVVVCTGVRPNTHLARKADLEVNNGVIVDNHLRTSDHSILAAGDVSEHNGKVYGVWGPSQFQGTIAGLNALGIDTPFGGMPRSNALKVLGIDMLSIGKFIPEDGSYQVVQDHDKNNFSHFVFHDGKMVGCILLGDTKPTTQIKKAIEGKKDFSEILTGSPDCAEIINNL